MNERLPDVQCTAPEIKTPIHQVGVQNIEVPFSLESKYGGYHKLNANVSMTASLDGETKGVSMSRFLLTLKPYLELPLKRQLINLILSDMLKKLETENVSMKFEFRMPIIRKSILTDNEFPIYYKCKFEMRKQVNSKSNISWFYQGVRVQYASYCPCSAELCSVLDEPGFPHNQRSYADVLVEVLQPYYVWLEDIIELVENEIKTLPYPVIKRPDEQEIARIAAQNPMFVEDAIRKISGALDENKRIHDWIVKCTHEESIHTSEAIAINWKGIKGGFDGRRFI